MNISLANLISASHTQHIKRDFLVMNLFLFLIFLEIFMLLYLLIPEDFLYQHNQYEIEFIINSFSTLAQSIYLDFKEHLQ